MKKRIKRACALLLSVAMVLGGPVGNGWAEIVETAEIVEGLSNAESRTDNIAAASASNAQGKTGLMVQTGHGLADSVLIGNNEKEYDKDFARLINDLELLHAGDLTDITEDEPVTLGEDVVIRFYYKLDEAMLDVLKNRECVGLEYHLPDKILALTNSYGELEGEIFGSGAHADTLPYKGVYENDGLVRISIETGKENSPDGNGYVDIRIAVDGEGITESPWEIRVTCGENELKKELFVSAEEEITPTNIEGDFEIDENGVLVKYHGDGGDVVIPDGVTKIGHAAFYYNQSVISVQVPESVIAIGDSAFSKCWSLNTVTVENGLEEIGDGAFAYSGLHDFVIPESVKKLGDGVFGSCTQLETVSIMTPLEKMPFEMFIYCENLKTVNIPESVVRIEENAFKGCEKLEYIKLPDGLKEIGVAAFLSCKSLKEIIIPSGVTEIRYDAFGGCESLTEIEIPYGITKITQRLLSNCTNLKDIKIPDTVTEIGGGAFTGCSSLENIEIPSGVNKIGEYAFDWCESLSSIKIPYGITKISRGLFYNCKKLRYVGIPDTVTEIETAAFELCSSLENIKIPSTVKKIDSYVFEGCESLSSIEIPYGITVLENYLFYRCKNLRYVKIPSTVNNICYEVFGGCEKLIINGEKGSYAESYAKEQKIAFVALDGIGKQTGFLARFLTWDPATQEATFDVSIPYHATEDTDMSFLDSLDTILGGYVWVEDHPTNVGQFLSITPLEERFGTITAAGSSFMTVDGESYIMRSNLAELVGMMKEAYLNQYVKYYVAGDIIYDIKVPELKKGVLKTWNSASLEVTIADPGTGAETVYPANLADLSVVASLDVWIGHEIGYSVLDGVVYRLITEAYETQTLAKIKDYDASSGLVFFEDGTVYGVSSGAVTEAGSYVGKWAVCTLTTSVDGVTAITGFSPLEAKLKVGLALEPGHDTLSYQDGKYSIDGTNYQKADAIEIPFAVDVRNTLDISEGDFQMYKAELQADEGLSLTTEAFTMEIPDGFYMEWADGRSFEAGKLLKPGDTWIIGGTLKIRSDYVPENGTVEIKAALTADKASADSKTKISLVKKDDTNQGDAIEEDVDWTNKSETYKKALSEVQSELDELAEDCIMSMDSTLTQYLSTTQIESVKRVLVLWISMLSDETLTDSYALRKGMDKSLGVTERPSSSELTAEITIHAETKKGEKDILFKISGNVYQFDKVSLGAWGTVGWEIPGEKVHGTCPFVRLGDIEGFCGKLEKCAEAAVQDAYGKVWGEMVDTVVKSDFIDKLLLDIIKNHCKSVSKGIFSLIWDGIANEIKEPELESLSNSDIRKFIKDAISVLNRLTNDEYSESFELGIKMGENVEKAYERWKGALTESKRDKTVKIQDLKDLDELYSKLYSHKDPDKLQLVHTETGSYASGKALKSGIVPKLEVKILNEGTDYDKAVEYAENSWFKKKPDIVVDISLKDEAGVSLQPNGKLTLRLSLGSGYAGKKVTVYHAVHDEYGTIKKWEDFTRTADEQGKIEFEVSSLSPFVIMTEGDTSSGDTDSSGSEINGNENDGNETDGNETGGNETGGNETDGNETGGNETDGNEASGNGGGNISSGSDGGSENDSDSSSTHSSAPQVIIPPTPGYWMQDEKGWRFMNLDGTAYLDTWVYVNSHWYRLGADGYMLERWALVNNMWYYLTPISGEMKTGWFFDGQNWYYFDENGFMKTGWILVDESWYFLGTDGQLFISTVTPDGYSVDGSGKWIH